MLNLVSILLLPCLVFKAWSLPLDQVQTSLCCSLGVPSQPVSTRLLPLLAFWAAWSSHEREATLARHMEAKPQPPVSSPNTMFSLSLPKLFWVGPALEHHFWLGLGREHELTVPASPCFPPLYVHLSIFPLLLFTFCLLFLISLFLLQPFVSFPTFDLGP